MHADTIGTAIRDVLREHGNVDSDALGEGDDLYLAGMTSFASVKVMLALEERFDVEFLDAMLNRSTFSTIGHISVALHELLDGDAQTV
ncbi:acyl carrier protein [Streptosporangium sp. NPDC051023]|uniref:acyl carrier protein n=1 Tax=Streptosporangium sp. NPDC051023 TaxID=3155410 RepID=UPI00344E4B43